MNESKPINFNAEMVRALLVGKKTQTRRVVDWEELHRQADLEYPTQCTLAHYKVIDNWALSASDGVMREVNAPYRKGDILWVREPIDGTVGCDANYLADGTRISDVFPEEEFISDLPLEVIPPEKMPKRLSRITLQVKMVRVERVGDISEEDAKEEGSEAIDGKFRLGFGMTWLRLGRTFETNPWVWVYEFDVLEVKKWQVS